LRGKTVLSVGGCISALVILPLSFAFLFGRVTSLNESEVLVRGSQRSVRAEIDNEFGIRVPPEAELVGAWRMYYNGVGPFRTRVRLRFPNTRPPGKWLDVIARRNKLTPIDGSLRDRSASSLWASYDPVKKEFEIRGGT